MIADDYLTARLVRDWKGTPKQVLAEIPVKLRGEFKARFTKKESRKVGCRGRVLCSCLCAYVNSRSRKRELQFPLREDIDAITTNLDRARFKMERLVKVNATFENGIGTLMAANDCWDRHLNLDEFARFQIMHNELLGTMDQYIIELEHLDPPRRDVVLQYGRMVVWAYIKLATKASDAQAGRNAKELLDCFQPSEINWVRDREEFMTKYPHFWHTLDKFLHSEHQAASTSPLKW
jgi:hypothetical protein